MRGSDVTFSKIERNKTKNRKAEKKARNQKIVGEPKKCLMVERCQATKCDDVTT